MKPIDRVSIGYETLGISLSTGNSLYSLYPYLFKGGAALDRRAFLSTDGLSPLIESRLPLIFALHEEFVAKKVSGTSHKTLENYYYALKSFFVWIDKIDRHISISTLAEAFIGYSEHLIEIDQVKRNVNSASTFTKAAALSPLLDGVLDLKKGLLSQTRIRKPRPKAPWQRSQNDEVNTDARAMGLALRAITTELTLERIGGALPIEIGLGKSGILRLGTRKCSQVIPPLANGKPDLARLKHERGSLINFRIEADMLLFISQTGMNLQEARTQRFQAFGFYKSKTHPDCYDVTRGYKSRKGGEVEFRVFAAYKPYFLSYLEMRSELFQNDADGSALFQFIESRNGPRPKFYELKAVQSKLEAIGVPYLGPRALRALRQNFLLAWTKDPALTANLGQHSKDILIRNYVSTDIGTAIREVAVFHRSTDSTLIGATSGACDQRSPVAIDETPENAPTPDCSSPSGCLFCIHQKDILSLDFMWSLASFRHMKHVQLSKYRGNAATEQPEYLVIKRVSEKLERIGQSSPDAKGWRKEAEERVRESWHHPWWKDAIEFIEETI